MAFVPPLCQIALSVTDLGTTGQWLCEGLGLQPADAIVAALHGRKRRAISPGWLSWVSRFRMLLRTRTASRINLKLVPRVDELTAETVTQRGAFAAAMAPTPACDAAAASIGRPGLQPKGDKG